MFPKKHRLQKAKEVQATFARGRAFFSPYFLIKYKNDPADKKFTVVVSTKVHKRAVVRNRIKRLMREAIKQQIKDLPSGYFVVIAKPKVMEIYDGKITAEVLVLLRKFFKGHKGNALN